MTRRRERETVRKSERERMRREKDLEFVDVIHIWEEVLDNAFIVACDHEIPIVSPNNRANGGNVSLPHLNEKREDQIQNREYSQKGKKREIRKRERGTTRKKANEFEVEGESVPEGEFAGGAASDKAAAFRHPRHNVDGVADLVDGRAEEASAERAGRAVEHGDGGEEVLEEAEAGRHHGPVAVVPVTQPLLPIVQRRRVEVDGLPRPNPLPQPLAIVHRVWPLRLEGILVAVVPCLRHVLSLLSLLSVLSVLSLFLSL
jgi:hypothetical protein